MVTGSKVNVSRQCPHVACRYSPDCSSRAGTASPWIGRFPTWRPSHSRAQPHSPRSGRVSLSGKLTVAPDRDSDDVNDAIARDFGTVP